MEFLNFDFEGHSKNFIFTLDSICKDGGFPESPPDSGSEHLMSPSSSTNFTSGSGSEHLMSPSSSTNFTSGGGSYTNSGISINEEFPPYIMKQNEMLPDLNKINYSVPLQMIESSDADYKVKSGKVR